ncbi:MAG TPA: DUF6445 family protein [Steroidobacteraceae bacterium]|jgi:uncharacterized protein DUF6445|nr:DUF6445 family protein [Steroidobacteraceae bacterium]
MNLDLHPDLRLRRLAIGTERAPLLVIDNFVADAEALVADACARAFTVRSRYFPGIRAEAPPAYQQLLLTRLRSALLDCLGMPDGALTLSMCHYSVVTTPAQELAPPQRIPHVDSFAKSGLATIHYLFKANLGGTAFYRHRRTGFESIDETRRAAYSRALDEEHSGPAAPGRQYINGSTDLFEQIAKQDGVFNRMLVYRRNSLHSGCIEASVAPDPNPATGRLSINSFIDWAPP